jgi:HEAT repeat protein
MTGVIYDVERVAWLMLWASVALASAMTLIVIVQRIALAVHQAGLRRLERRYGPVIERALRGDREAIDSLARCPRRLQLPLARLLITPLIEVRDQERIAATRKIARAMALVPVADRYIQSRRWWRRTVALRALGLLQFKERSSQIVAALDDPNTEVRNAALDALADIMDPATLPAIIVRLHDTSLQRGRRAAALSAFGSQAEGFLVDLAAVDPEHRFNYSRALGFCGTARSRPMLCEWIDDARAEVRAAALEALARIGLDDHAARFAIAALDNHDARVRAMAAAALHGWTGPGDAAARLAQHLDDTWMVAVQAARSLQSMRDLGRIQLEARANRSDLGGVLARQMLWETEVRL